MVCGPASIDARVTFRSASSSYATSSGAKHSRQTWTGASGTSLPHSRHLRPRAGDPVRAGALMVIDLLIFPTRLRGTELAPGASALVAGASSGRIPGAPLDENCSVVPLSVRLVSSA